MSIEYLSCEAIGKAMELPCFGLRLCLTDRIMLTFMWSPCVQTVVFAEDPLEAYYTGGSPAGDISRGRLEPLLFDASPSADPSDPNNAAQAMRCVEELFND